MLPKEFFAVPKWFPSNVEEAVEICVDATVQALVEQILRLEKDRLKPDRKNRGAQLLPGIPQTMMPEKKRRKRRKSRRSTGC